MKHILKLTCLLLMALSLNSCLEDSCEVTRTFHIWDAVYVQPQDFRIDIITEPGKNLNTPGKIYFYNNYVLVNELREGVHIIDNTDPQNPQNVAFINIPGNVDMAVKENVLFADSYVDLLSIDITDPTSPRLLSRCEDVFPLQGFDDRFGYLSHYVETTEELELECDDPNFGQQWWWFQGNERLAVDANLALDVQAGVTSGEAATSIGIGGSLARFTTTGDYLYSVSNFNLKVFGLKNLAKPALISEVSLGWGIETIFPHGDNLFIGANDGMYILDNSNPELPELLSRFNHAQACDPVFVVGDLAYVTLRDGNRCQNFNNQLDVVDVSNLSWPKLLATHPMHNPHGLSVADNHVFICENDEGLKVFDVTDIESIGDQMVEHVKGLQTYDIITLPNKVAMVIGADGLYQFDYSDPSNLKQISVIPVSRN